MSYTGTGRSLACSLVCLGLVAAVVVVSSACGNKAGGSCDPGACAPGNQCLALGVDVRCRKTCSSNTDPQTSCPFGYACQDQLNGSPAFCVESKARLPNGQPLQKKDTGQWGATCNATKGVHNADCDSNQGFLCYAHEPTDAQAYCTRYDCTVDAECGPGFFCTKINATPNADTADRSTIGPVQSACIRRTYCATCFADLDCPTIGGVKQHCIPDDKGVTFCAPECTGAGTCPNEAKCIQGNFGPQTICYPRAKSCVGDGTLCSPCRADSDCGDDGACIKGDYTSEWACAKKTAACKSCPRTVPGINRPVGCLEKSNQTQPANYCFGLYSIGGVPSDIGCYSADR